MQKQLFRVITRLVLLCVLLSSLSLIVVHAWSDYDYFDAVSSCDGNYFDTLDTCRQLPFYPITPSEGDCRYDSGNNFLSCLNGIPSPASNWTSAPWPERRTIVASSHTDLTVETRTWGR